MSSEINSGRFLEGKFSRYVLESYGPLRLSGRIYVPLQGELRTLILAEAHHAPYSAHPGVKKMHADLRRLFFWSGMKHDIADYVARCLKCQRVKVEHQHPKGLLQPNLIPSWKWDIISMDFIVGLSMTFHRHDAIMVTIDQLTKVAHLTPIRSSYTATSMVDVFM